MTVQQSVRFLIVGMGRSGTTLLQRLVSELDSVWVPPETHFWRHAAELANRFPPPLSRGVALEALEWFLGLDSSAGIHVDPENLAGRLKDDVYLWDLFNALVRAMSPETSKYLGEKTPDHAFWALQLLRAIPDLNVLGLVRDPREVYRSQQSLPWGIASPWGFAEKWVAHSRVLDDAERIFPNRVRVFRYEDLVHRVDEIREQCADLIGAPHGVSPHSAGNALFKSDEWWKEGALGNIEAKADRWRREVNPEAVSAIEWRARSEMVRREYELSTDLATPVLDPDMSLFWVRQARVAEAAMPLPITEAQASTWLSSDLQASKRWRETAQRERQIADAKFARLKARRWWRLGESIQTWSRNPVRIDRLVRDSWSSMTIREDLPLIPSRFDETPGDPDLNQEGAWIRAAAFELARGNAKNCLEILHGIPDEYGQLLAKHSLMSRCYQELGEVSAALASARLAGAWTDMPDLDLRVKTLEGLVRATEPGWLPDVAIALPGRAEGAGVAVNVLEAVPSEPSNDHIARLEGLIGAQRHAGLESKVVSLLPRDGAQGSQWPREMAGVSETFNVDLGPGYELRQIPRDEVLSDEATVVARMCVDLGATVMQVSIGPAGWEAALVGAAVARRLSLPWVLQLATSTQSSQQEGELGVRIRDQLVSCVLSADAVLIADEGQLREVTSLGVAPQVATIGSSPDTSDIPAFTYERFLTRPFGDSQ